MSDPFDPRTPLYEGQAVQQPLQQPQPAQVQQPQANAASLHFIEGLGYLATGIGTIFGGGSDEEGEETEEAPRRRSFRPRVFGANTSKRVGKGPCCRRPTR